MKNRQLDVTLQSAGLGVASLRDLAVSMTIVIVEIPADVVAKVGDPAYLPAVIPAGTYDRAGEGRAERRDPELPRHPRRRVDRHGLQDDQGAVGEPGRAGRRARRRQEHQEGSALEGMPLPLHPGAEKYYREVGLMK